MSARVEAPAALDATLAGAAAMLARLKLGLPVSLRLNASAAADAAKALAALERSGHCPLDFVTPGPLPEGLRHVHPSWLRTVLALEPPNLAAALVRRLAEVGLTGLEGPWQAVEPASIPPFVLHDLVWSVFGPLSDPHPAPTAELPERAVDAATAAGAPKAILWQRLSGAVLWRALCERGAAEVGRSLHRAEPAMRARTMAMVGAPWAEVIARFAAAPVDAPARDRARLAVARASAMAAEDQGAVEPAGRPDAEVRLALVGLCAAMPEMTLAGPSAIRTMALRLPAVVGRWLCKGILPGRARS